MNYRIIKRKLDLSLIPIEGEAAKLLNEYADRIVKVKQSIVDNGWIPDFGELSYHGDTAVYSLPFMVWENKKGEVRVPNAQHRLAALNKLDYKEIDAYVQTNIYDLKYTKEEIESKVNQIKLELKGNGKGMFQSFEFDYNIKLKSRDDSYRIFLSTEWDAPYYINKKVLDIACNGGYFAFQAKRNGAQKVIGFDRDSYMIEKACQFRDLLNFDVDLIIKDFWDFDWSQKFDIVFCNQCIYHFANSEYYSWGHSRYNSEEIYNSLDLICNATINNLVMFTFINFKDPNFNDFSNGYRPGYLTLTKDLFSRGFKEVIIYHIPGSTKQTIVASKQPWEYLKFLSKSKNIKHYDSTIHIDNNKIPHNIHNFKWWDLSKKELKNLWK